MRWPDQICGVCGGKGHSLEICPIVVTVLACVEHASDAAISGGEAEAFMCDTPSKVRFVISRLTMEAVMR